ncbi:hypothetical protein GOBAR_AA23412 [Gossypium barbadense]|uniref:FBD domain-containing protein n=1 Tax=Gossypium barbadense TaxID=3634 RepID=A0A2P5X1Q0_GOSBA|nr:hypothetical protein GOBAR_AA23412 [Gossypium barbadense]
MATSILSKRWLWVWTSVPILDLQDTPFCRTDPNLHFRQFVDHVLILNKTASLDRFCLKFNLVDHPSYVKTWFRDAVSRDVKELDIRVHGTESFPFLKLPFALFTAKTLHVLKLSHGVELHVPGTVSLPCLKELTLHKHAGDNTTCSNISIPTLKTLFVWFAPTGRRRHKLKINAPVLKQLNLEDNLTLEFDLEDVSSLVEANVTVSWLENRHIPLLKALSNAKFVSFHWDWYAEMKWRNFRPYRLFLNLVQMELHVGYGGWNLLSLLLEISDHLEVLVLAKNDNCRGLGFECSWKPPKYVPKCLLSSLSMVYFKGFEDLTYQLSMVKYILKNARVLKMVDISSNGDLPLDSKIDLLKKLLMFPRGSKACQLKFN